jgi:hypothetical protein
MKKYGGCGRGGGGNWWVRLDAFLTSALDRGYLHYHGRTAVGEEPGTHWMDIKMAKRKRPCTLWRGTTVENRKGLWCPLEGHQGGEQKGTVVPTGGAPWW